MVSGSSDYKEIKFDGTSTNKFFYWLAAKFVEISLPEIGKAVEASYSDDELLTLKEVSERILKCNVITADKYFLYQPGFPYVEIGNQRRYPKRQVEECIQQHTKYN